MKRQNYGYVYPNGLDLHPDSEKSKQLVGILVERFNNFGASVSAKHEAWRNLDNSLKAYIDTDEEEEAIKASDERKPVSIVMPISYAILESLLSFMMQRFLTDTFFRYQGYDPKDDLKAKLLEKIIGHQFVKNKMALNLHTMWRDAFVYSVGPVYVNWEVGKNHSGEVVKEGNKLINIDPYNILPDDSVPLVHYDRATHFGWVSYMTKEELLDREIASDNAYYNALYVEKGSRTTSFFTERNVTRTQSGLTEVLHCFVNLIPSEFSLGRGLYPEKWYFEIASKSIILRMEKIGGADKRFPFVVAVPEFNGHETFGTSRIEIIRNLQGLYDWMLNTHVANVRKSLYDMWVVDPSMINMDDLLSPPKDGRIIRVRRSSWGNAELNKAIQQLPVNDVTRQHVQDSSFIESMISKVSGITDASLGIQNRKGERVSSTEAQYTAQNAVSRLERLALLFDIQVHQDLAELVARNTLDFTSAKFSARVNAEEIKDLMRSYPELNLTADSTQVLASRDFLNTSYDVVPYAHGADFKSSNHLAWIELFKVFGNMPQLTQQLDIAKVFLTVAKSLGIKDVGSFLHNSDLQIKTEEEIEKGVQSGQLRGI